MKYAIIGSGAIGSALAGQFARRDLDVLVANSRGPASLQGLVVDLGTRIKPARVKEAVRAELVILAVPFDAVPAAVAGIGDWGGRIVVDATNAIEFPAFIPKDLGGRASTEVVTEVLSGARVVKAFNTLPAATLAADPAQGGGRRVVVLSGNDAAARGEVAGLIEYLGFAALDLGTLGEATRLQQFGGTLSAVDLIRRGKDS